MPEHPGPGAQHCGAVLAGECPALGRRPRHGAAKAFWNKPPCSSLSPQAPLKKLFPSLISITWPLLFFDYEGTYVQVGGDEKIMFPKERSPKTPKLDGWRKA